MSDAHSTRRRVLIVTPAFPPVNTPDMQRARMSLPYYRDYGWDPIVLTVHPDYQTGVRENALLATIPDDIPVHHCKAVSQQCARWLGLGNLGLRAWRSLLFTGSRLIEQEKIDLVFITNTQFITFTLGRIWKKRHGIPYVIDLQDPWRTDYYKKVDAPSPPGGWKYFFARFQARLLEGWSFKRTSAVMSVSSQYLEALKTRYPWFSKTPSDVIPFGVSENDLIAAASLPIAGSVNSKSHFCFVYTGAVGGIMHESIRTLFEGIRAFRSKYPAAADRLRFSFLGTSYAAPGQGKPSVLPLAKEYEIMDLVEEQPDRLGHLESLRQQSKADVLLLLGSNDPAYSPSKVYPYFLSGRPILAVTPPESNLEKQLLALQCAIIVNSGTSRQNSLQLEDFFRSTLDGSLHTKLPVRNEALFKREYLASALTQRQCALFDHAIGPA